MAGVYGCAGAHRRDDFVDAERGVETHAQRRRVTSSREMRVTVAACHAEIDGLRRAAPRSRMKTPILGELTALEHARAVVAEETVMKQFDAGFQDAVLGVARWRYPPRESVPFPRPMRAHTVRTGTLAMKVFVHAPEGSCSN